MKLKYLKTRTELRTKLQYLPHVFLLCSPVTGKTVSTQLQVAVSSGVSLLWHRHPLLLRVHLQPHPQQLFLLLLYLVAAALKYVCASLTGCCFGEEWSGWAGLRVVEDPDLLPHDKPAVPSH